MGLDLYSFTYISLGDHMWYGGHHPLSLICGVVVIRSLSSAAWSSYTLSNLHIQLYYGGDLQALLLLHSSPLDSFPSEQLGRAGAGSRVRRCWLYVDAARERVFPLPVRT